MNYKFDEIDLDGIVDVLVLRMLEKLSLRVPTLIVQLMSFLYFE